MVIHENAQEIFFLKNQEENEAKKVLYEVRASGMQLSFNIFDSPEIDIQKNQAV